MIYSNKRIILFVLSMCGIAFSSGASVGRTRKTQKASKASSKACKADSKEVTLKALFVLEGKNKVEEFEESNTIIIEGIQSSVERIIDGTDFSEELGGDLELFYSVSPEILDNFSYDEKKKYRRIVNTVTAICATTEDEDLQTKLKKKLQKRFPLRLKFDTDLFKLDTSTDGIGDEDGFIHNDVDVVQWFGLVIINGVRVENSRTLLTKRDQDRIPLYDI